MGINEWLEFSDYMSEYKKDRKEWNSEFQDSGNDSVKAFAAWAAKADVRTSKLSPYKQKRRWQYKRQGPKSSPKISEPSTVKRIAQVPALKRRQARRKRNTGVTQVFGELNRNSYLLLWV